MALSFFLIGLATVAYCLYLHFTRTFIYWRDRDVAGPAPVPIFGNTMKFSLRRKCFALLLKDIYDDYPNEKIVGIYLMTAPCLLIRDPDIIKQVMIKDFDIFAGRHAHECKEVLARNLFQAEEKTWRILRNKFTPLFTSAKLKNMFYLMTEASDKFIEFVEKSTQTQQEQEAYELMSKYTLMNIATCAFGLELDLKGNNAMNALMMISKKMGYISRAGEFEILFPGLFTKLGFSVFSKEITNFFKDLVAQVTTARNGKPTGRNDLIDLLLELKQSNTAQGSKRLESVDTYTLDITEDIMAAQAFVFFFAGYDTSATAMPYMLYQLALNPDIQERVVAEIEQVLERNGGGITFDALKDLILLDRVLNESLRMHPNAGALRRFATADYEVPGTNVTIKKGQTIFIAPHGLHNDEKYWPEPSKFDPDRFSPENVAKRHPAVYVPFGIGPRNCIGLRFARTQILLVMAKLLINFRVEATESTREELRYDPYRIVTFPIGGIKVKLVHRQSQGD